jgi:hypothetical protein
MIFKPTNKTYYLFIDLCGRHWQLIPVANVKINQPFIIKPLTAEQYSELSR